MENLFLNRTPALSLGFRRSWTYWTGWICFSLLDLFRSSRLLKPKEFKCPARACAPLPCPAFYLLFFSSNEASLQISISWNTPSWLFKSPPLEKGSQCPQRTAWCFISGLRDKHHSECLSVTGPCRDTVTQTLQVLSAASSSLLPTCRLDANPQTTDGSHWDCLCIKL